MRIYAESSAVVAWLLGEAASKGVRAVLEAAEAVVASDLTLVETDRVLVRAVVCGDMDEAEAAGRRTLLSEAAAHWHLLRLSPNIIERARQPLPAEPIRSLDALHLASALAARTALPAVEMLSLDVRVRRSATLLGFRLHPA